MRAIRAGPAAMNNKGHQFVSPFRNHCESFPGRRRRFILIVRLIGEVGAGTGGRLTNPPSSTRVGVGEGMLLGSNGGGVITTTSSA
jgi:hypothetical protein